MENNKHFVEYKIFNGFENLLAFTTSKQSLGVEKIRFTDNVENKEKLANLLNIPADKLIFPKQTHTNCVADINDRLNPELDDTDALVTNKPGVCICVQTADCVPILLFDPEKKVLAAVHAGWRGTVGKITQAAILKMIKMYDCKAANIVAAIGPSISPEIYEVGDEVVKTAKQSIPNANKTLQKNSSGKFHFNLWEANKQLLIACGLDPFNIEVLAECSYLNPQKYYSARREGIKTGRMVSGIMLKA